MHTPMPAPVHYERRFTSSVMWAAASLAVALAACGGAGDDGQGGRPRAVETSAAPKPIVENPQSIDYLFPPDRIAEMVAESAAVVVARYDGMHVTRDTGEEPPAHFIETTYTLTVQEIIKPHGALRRMVELWLPVGEFEHADRIVRSRTADVAAPAPGHTYLVFLTVNRRTGELMGAWGPSSLYDVSGERVAPTAAHSPHEGRPVFELLDEVRSAAGR